MADGQAVYRNVVLEESLESVGIRVVVKLRPVETIGDQKDDLASTCSSIMKQLGGRMDGVVKCFGWAGTKVSRCRLGRFAHSEWMARWRGDEGDGAGSRRAAMTLGILQMGPYLGDEAAKSLTVIRREVKAADDGLVVETDSGSDGAQSGSHLCSVLRFQIVVDQDDKR